MERKSRLSICVVGVAQWPELASSNRLGRCEGVASQQIYMSLMNEGRQPRDILIPYAIQALWAFPSFTDTSLRTLQIFKLYRADVADSRMPAFCVVEPFNVIEDIRA